MAPEDVYIKDFNYELPAERIATHPLPQRDASKLLVYREGRIRDEHFSHLADELPSDAVLVINDTRVIEARLLFRKTTGGVIEIFCLEPEGSSIETALGRTNTVRWQCLIGGASKWKKGQVLEKDIVVNGQPVRLTAHYIEKGDGYFIIEFNWTPEGCTFAGILHEAGAIPLPPYMHREVTMEDSERYQTVFAKHEGSVAAPTASLHFTPGVFETLEQKNIRPVRITLHVGAGTFQPVKTEKVSAHHMHQESFMVSQDAVKSFLEAATLIVAGTTSLRTIESLYWMGVKLLKEAAADWKLEQWEAYTLDQKYPGVTARESLETVLLWMKENKQEVIHCSTSLIIVPGYSFHLPHALITNFHQPQSTLLLLVAAFIGPDWKKVYDHALDHGYRFLSYGDSSVLWRR